MKKTLSLMVITLSLTMPLGFIFGPAKISAQTTATPPVQTPKPALTFGLPDGSPVRLRTTQTLSSADAKTNDTIDFEVLDDVKIGETIIVPRGGTAIGTVTRAKPKARMGRGGKLDIAIEYVRLNDGGKAALRAVKETKGGGHVGAMTGAMVATGILFFPAAPFFLFMKGKDITIPKGTEITAYINGDIPLDAQKFNPQPTQPNVTAEQAAAEGSAQMASVSVKSTPDGAEITVDDKFVGSTPSTLQLTPGDHKISVKKDGYLLWERTMTSSIGSNVTLDATLEKIP